MNLHPTNISLIEEIETKLDIPLDHDISMLLQSLKHLLLQSNWDITAERTVQREYEYFDTSNFLLARHSHTLRRVMDKRKIDENKLYRFDYKLTTNNQVFETSPYYSNERLAVDHVLTEYGLYQLKECVHCIAKAKTEHIKFNVARETSRFEITIDIFKINQELAFQELECELKQGDKRELEQLTNTIAENLNLSSPDFQQKYRRVLNYLSKTSNTQAYKYQTIA